MFSSSVHMKRAKKVVFPNNRHFHLFIFNSNVLQSQHTAEESEIKHRI